MLLYLLQLHFPQENVSRPKYYMVHGKWENEIKCYHVIANNIFNIKCVMYVKFKLWMKRMGGHKSMSLALSMIND